LSTTKQTSATWYPDSEDEGHRCRLSRDSDEALRALEERRPQLVTWISAAGHRHDGLEVLSIIKRSTRPSGVSFPATAHRDCGHRHQARRHDYNEKPFKADRLIRDHARTGDLQPRREVGKLKERSTPEKTPRYRPLDGGQPAPRPLDVRADQQPLLASGASVSGKELAARVLHSKSSRAEGRSSF